MIKSILMALPNIFIKMEKLFYNFYDKKFEKSELGHICAVLSVIVICSLLAFILFLAADEIWDIYIKYKSVK